MDKQEIQAMKDFIYETAGEQLKLQPLLKTVRNSPCSHTLLMKYATCLTIPYPRAPKEWDLLVRKYLLHYRYQLATILQMDHIRIEEKKIYIPPLLKVEKEKILTEHIGAAYREKALGNQSLQTVAQWLCDTTEIKNSFKTVHNTLVMSI